jgi:alkyl hydroperoxide reductase subunit AhpF
LAVTIFRASEEARVRELLAGLERHVELLVALGPEETPLPGARDIDFAGETIRLCEEIASLAGGVSVRIEEEPSGFDRFPAVSVRPEGRDAGVRYDGLPWGYELSSLIGAIREAGRTQTSLRADSVAALADLDRDVRVDVFVTPT